MRDRLARHRDHTLGDTCGNPAMEPTGERLVPEHGDDDLKNEHLARYAFAEALAADKRVLDAGCGTGYGSARLAKTAASVCALDNSSEAIQHGRAGNAGIWFVRGDCTALPLADASVDLVVAFEVIEHLDRWTELVQEARRVLDPNGVFLASTPNRTYYRASREAPNPYHVHEFNYEEFRAALAGCFDRIAIYMENHTPAVSLSSGERASGRARFESPGGDPRFANFFVAVCSNSSIDVPADLVYVPRSGNVLRERELHIAKLERWARTLEARHGQVEARMSRELRRLPYRIVRRLGLAPRLPSEWSD